MNLTSRINVPGLVLLLLFTVSVAAQPQGKRKNPLKYEQIEEMVRGRVGLAIIRKTIETEGVSFVPSPAEIAGITRLNPIAAETIIAAIKNNLTYTLRIECKPDCDLMIGDKKARTQDGVYETDTTSPEIAVTASRPNWSASARLGWANPVKKWYAVIYKLSCKTPGCEIHLDDGGLKPGVRAQEYEYATDSGTIKAWATASGYKESDHIEITRTNPAPPPFVLARIPYKVSLSCKPVDCRFLIPEGNQTKIQVAQEDGKYAFDTTLEAVVVKAENDRKQSLSALLTPGKPDYVFDFGPIVYSFGCVDRGAPIDCNISVMDLGKPQVTKGEFKTYSTSVVVRPLPRSGYDGPIEGVTVDARNPLRNFEVTPVLPPFVLGPRPPAATYTYILGCVEEGRPVVCSIIVDDSGQEKPPLPSSNASKAEYKTTAASISARPVLNEKYLPVVAVTLSASNPRYDFSLKKIPDPESILKSIRDAIGRIAEDAPMLAQGSSIVSVKGGTTHYGLVESALGTRNIRWDFLESRQSADRKVEYFTIGRDSEPASSVKLFTEVKPQASSWKLGEPDTALKDSLTEYAAARPAVLIKVLADSKPQFTTTEEGEKALRVERGTDIYIITYNAEFLPSRIQHRQQVRDAADDPGALIADIRYQNYVDVGGGKVPYRIDIRIADRPSFSQTICVDTYYVWPGKVADDRRATVSKYTFEEKDRFFINSVTNKDTARENRQNFACSENAR